MFLRMISMGDEIFFIQEHLRRDLRHQKSWQGFARRNS